MTAFGSPRARARSLWVHGVSGSNPTEWTYAKPLAPVGECLKSGKLVADRWGAVTDVPVLPAGALPLVDLVDEALDPEHTRVKVIPKLTEVHNYRCFYIGPRPPWQTLGSSRV